MGLTDIGAEVEPPSVVLLRVGHCLAEEPVGRVLVLPGEVQREGEVGVCPSVPLAAGIRVADVVRLALQHAGVAGAVRLLEKVSHLEPGSVAAEPAVRQ
eukprot:3932088-Rhodomonas_salina.2